MSGPSDRPRVYINWSHVRPRSLRGWATLVGFVALAFVGIALVAVIASTLFFVALVIVIASAVSYFVGSLFRPRRRRDVEPYRGGYE